MCRRFVGLGMLFLCFCMELLIGRNVYASQLQSGINDESALNSSVVWQFADQYDYGEIDETLKELFPKERLDFKAKRTGSRRRIGIRGRRRRT